MTRRTLLLTALIASLVVNGVLLGAWLGRALDRDRGLYAMSHHILKRPPEELSDAARAVLEAKRGDMRSAFRQLRAARRNLDRVISEPELDVARAREALENLRNADQSLKTLVHEVLLEVLPNMPAEQREQLLRHRKRHGEGHHRHDRGAMPPTESRCGGRPEA